MLAVSPRAGCVDRKFVIESNVPNAQVYIDDKPIGAAPAYAPFEYYGYYTITLVHPGYETHVKRVHVVAPWYAYPPFDFLAEVLWPFHIRDTRRYYFELYEATQTRTDDILNAADALAAARDDAARCRIAPPRRDRRGTRRRPRAPSARRSAPGPGVRSRPGRSPSVPAAGGLCRAFEPVIARLRSDDAIWTNFVSNMPAVGRTRTTTPRRPSCRPP